MTTQQDVIKQFMASLDKTTLKGTDALDEAVKVCSNGKFSSLQDLIDKCSTDVENATNATEFLLNKCGIELRNGDTGAITGSDAGGTVAKNAEDIIPEIGPASYPSETSFTKRGLTFIVPEKSTLTDDEQMIIQGLYSWWAEEALKLIEESYGYSFNDPDVSVKEICVSFCNDTYSSMLAGVSPFYSNGKAISLELNINMNYYKNLSDNDINGKSLFPEFYLDRNIAHELTHAIMMAKIDNFKYLNYSPEHINFLESHSNNYDEVQMSFWSTNPQFIIEGLAELTHGIDDERENTIISMIDNKFLRKELDLGHEVNYPRLSFSGDASQYIAGYILLRYLARQSVDTVPTIDAHELYKEEDYIISEGGNYSIYDGFKGKITINTSEAVTINDFSKNNHKKVNKIVAGVDNIDLTIKNLVLYSEFNSDDSKESNAITFGAGTNNRLKFLGSNEIKGSWKSAIDIGGGLTISGDGTLDIGSSLTGIGVTSDEHSNANLTIDSGEISINSIVGIGANCDNNSTAAMGNINITGEAKIDLSRIGSANNSSVGDINIDGNAEMNISAIGKNGESTVGNVNIKGQSKVTAINYANDQPAIEVSEGSAINIGENAAVKILTYDNVTTRINGQDYEGSQLIFENGKFVGLGYNAELNITSGGTYVLDRFFTGKININTTEEVIIDGTTAGKLNDIHIVANADNINLTINNFNVYNPYDQKNGSLIQFGSGSDNKLIVKGKNEIISNYGEFGYDCIDIGGGLLIDGDGTLNIDRTGYGSAIGITLTYKENRYQSVNPNASLTISGGIINAKTEISPVIGSWPVNEGGMGNINITGNAEVNAKSSRSGIYCNNSNSKLNISGNAKVMINSNGDTSITSSNDISINDDAVVELSGRIALTGNCNLSKSAKLIVNNSIESYSESYPDRMFTINNDGVDYASLDECQFVFTNGTLSSSKGKLRLAINKGGIYNIPADYQGKIIINTTEPVTLDGSAGNLKELNVSVTAENADLTIKNLNLPEISKHTLFDSVIEFGKGKDNKLTIIGDNYFYNQTYHAVINIGGGLTIDGSGTLKIEGIGYQSSVIGIDSHEESSADLLIKGATIKITDIDDDSLGAAIGSGCSGSMGNITITGNAKIETSDSEYGAGIGSGSGGSVGNIVINGNATVKTQSRYGAAIGAGAVYLGNSSAGDITIGGNAVVKANAVAGDSFHKGDFGSPIGYGTPYVIIEEHIIADESINITTETATVGLINIIENADVTLDNEEDGNIRNVTINGNKYSAERIQLHFVNGEQVDGIAAVDDSTLTSDDDTLNASDDTITSGDDTLNTSDDTITSGDDTLNTGDDTITSDDDTLNTSDDTVTSGDDNLPAETISSSDDTIPAETVPAGEIYNGTDKADLLIGGDGYDTLTGGKGKDTLTGGSGADVFIYANGDGNDIIMDYTPGEDVIRLTSGSIKGSSLSGSDVVLRIGSGSIKLKDTKNKEIKIIDSRNNTSTLIYGSTFEDTITSTSKTDSLYGNKGNDIIKGYEGADTLIGGKGDDTLSGGDGKDVFVYANGDGNDVITDFTSGKDKIKLLTGSITNSSVSGYDVILNIGTGSIKLKNKKDKKIIVIDSSGKSTSKVYGIKDLTVNNSTKLFVRVDEGVETIDASKRTKAVKITGNSAANIINGGSKLDTIYGGGGNDSIIGNAGNDKLYGEAGNDILLGGAGADTLTGGKGNDTLTGEAGKDVFVYASGDGKDVITDYTAKQDKIKLTSGTISSSSIKGSDVVLKIGTGSITVKDGKGKSITVVDSKGKSTSKVYGTSKKNYWFTEDDNIITSEMDSIINNDSKLISNDYNYDFNSTLTKQLNQTLVTNSIKQQNK